MIPLKALPDSPRPPMATRTLAASVALMWALQLGARMITGRDWATSWGVRPACYFSPASCGIGPVSLPSAHLVSWQGWAHSAAGHLALSPLVALWLHADWWHVGFNLLFLWVFGSALEAEVGAWRVLRLFLAGGLVATACHVAFHPASTVPTIGASGAVAALMGAYFWRLPRAWVLTYFPPIFVLPVPSPLFGVLWLAAQFIGATGAFHGWLSAVAPARDVAWTAHLGGFAWGALAAWRMGKRRGPRAGKRPLSKAARNMGK